MLSDRDYLLDLPEPTEEDLRKATQDPDEPLASDEVTLVSLDELEPDLSDDIGAESPMLAAEEGEPWFPPTDPVIAPEGNDAGGARVVGGLGPAHDEDFRSGLDTGLLPLSDDELANAVYEALERDALTNGLDIDVYVTDAIVTLRGRAPTLDDAEAAEAVAGRVPGVVDVQEELTVEGL